MYTYSSPFVSYVDGVPSGGLNVSGGDTLSIYGYYLGVLNTVRTALYAFAKPLHA
jgi:hypothetical protein